MSGDFNQLWQEHFKGARELESTPAEIEAAMRRSDAGGRPVWKRLRPGRAGAFHEAAWGAWEPTLSDRYGETPVGSNGAFVSDQALEELLVAALEPVRGLESSKDELRNVMVRAGQWRRGSIWRIGRRQILVAIGTMLLLGGAAAGSLFNPDSELDQRIQRSGPLSSTGDPALDRLVAEARTHPDLAPVANTITIERRVPDPTGGAPWVLVVWRTETGGWCSVAGRQHGGQVGVTDRAGRFKRFPFHEGGRCNPDPLQPDQASIMLIRFPNGLTILNGVLGSRVVRLRVRGIPGLGILLPSERGGVLGVVSTKRAQRGLHIERDLGDGQWHPGATG